MTARSDTLGSLLGWWRDGRRVALMVVMRRQGSTPGRPGFAMAVADDGALVGSVGGGDTEHRLVEKARAGLAVGRTNPQTETIHLDAPSTDSGLICGGTVTVLTRYLDSTDAASLEAFLDATGRGIPAALRVAESGLTSSTEFAGAESLVQTGGEPELVYEMSDDRAQTATLIGGGHVSLALTQVLRPLGFRIVVVDSRPHAPTFAGNSGADLRIVAPFDEAATHVTPGNSSFVVIMTPSHRWDEIVLRGLIEKPLGYLGMMASRRKASMILENLRQAGIPRERLDLVHTPVGLDIGSHTPAEIAISIAAEMVAVRNGAC